MMLHLMISIIGILVTIFFVIGSHEAAHFAAARWLKVKVLRFSIGFGKTLACWHDKSGTEYVLALIPLGGYVKMLDESEGTVAPEERHLAYNNQPYYKKFLIVIAGPLMNIVCAFLLYWLIFMIGFTTIKPVIGTVQPHSIAAKAGLSTQQEIIKADDEAVNGWMGILFRLVAHAGNQDQIKIETVALDKQAPAQTYILDLGDWKLDGLTPDPLASIGITPYVPDIPLLIGTIAKNSPAIHANLQVNDKLIAINQKNIKTWDEFISIILAHPEQTLTFTIERNHQQLKIPVTIGYQRDLFLQKTGYLGVSPNFQWPSTLLRHIQYGPLESLPHAWQQLYDFTYFNILLVGKLITGKVSLQSLGGPITIFDTAGEALQSGWISFLGFLAFLSISIGVINLLPIPGLDGGHLFMQTIEFIIRRPLPEKVIEVLYKMGFMLILFVLGIALVNDLLRLV